LIDVLPFMREANALDLTPDLRHRLGAILPFVNDILASWEAMRIDIRDPSDYSAVVVWEAINMAVQGVGLHTRRKIGSAWRSPYAL
jgi:hypothetical protein